MRRYFIGLFLLLLVSFAQSQVGVVSEVQVRAELEKRGISEEELIKAMQAKGIEVEDLENLTPSQIAELEVIVSELEASNKQVSATDAQNVNKEVFLDAPGVKETEQLKEEIKEVVKDAVKVEPKPSGIYGHSFFKNRDLSVFETSTEVKAPDSYILGSGDKIVISIFGISREELALEVDSDGYIEVLQRKIFLKGMSLGNAKKKLFDNLSRSYRFTVGQFDVSLSYSRTINVNIQGEVSSPGGYTISAINNAFNGLVAAGGPSGIGSLRDILLIRKDGSVSNLDFYSYLQNPSTITDTYLEEGDVIVVPVARKIVSITGGVKRPIRYEMKSSETLDELILLAGGFTGNANRELLQIIRFGLDGTRYLDVSAANINGFALKDGDQIKINTIENEVDNFVAVSGPVVNGGQYERVEGMRIRDLLQRAVLKPLARLELAFIRRIQEDGKIIYIPINIEAGSSDLEILLVDKDQLTVASLSAVNENLQFQVSGAVRSPGGFAFGMDQSISIKTAIDLAGGLRRDASGIGIIHTIDPLNPKVKEYKRINLADAYQDTSAYLLGVLDSLEIFAKTLFEESSAVSIVGAVNSQGSFQYGFGMTLADLLTMSGGFKLGAATNRVEVYRLVIKDNEPTKVVVADLNVSRELADGGENLDFVLEPYDEVVVRYVPEFEFQQIVILEGEVKFPGQYSLIKDNETVRDLILRAGGPTIEAFPAAAKLIRAEDDLGVVIIKLDQVLDNAASRFNFKLKAGDRIILPKSKDFVSISGFTNASKLYSSDILGTQNQLNVPFHEGKSAKFYLEQYAGGVSDIGSRKEVYVENANGEITRTKNYILFKDYPNVKVGAKIVVGAKPAKTERQKEREDVDWSRVLADAVSQAVSILSLLLLIQRI